ncbi:hypothetical protein [Pseudoxanthomonas suwonensis]|jgi:hypothetical protein|uniref:hypothetical protein n=1 Tax=Pseudoxanthomonas suwonensis TaxID=314722 RepID=UPI00138F51D1|nr:hypothetical protein [Pseudoxanthomonas suwonensis]
MRELMTYELCSVAGGNGNSAARDAALKQCEGLPDNTGVSFTIEVSANVGGKFNGIGGEAKTTQTVNINTTCGDLRAAESGKS